MNYYGNPPFNTANVQSGIGYQPMYDNQATANAQNQAHANAMQMANPRFNQRQFMGQGTRRSAGTMAAGMHGVNQARLAAQLAGPNQQFEDQAANEQQRLNVEQAQFGDAMGQLGNLTNLQNPAGFGMNQYMQRMLAQLIGA